MKRGALLAAIALVLVVACGGTSGSPSARSSPPATASPGPQASASPSGAAPAPTDVPSATPPASIPPPTSSAIQIPHHGEALNFSGGISGKVTNAEVKDCGAGPGGWGLDLSNFSVGSATASLTLQVTSYTGPGSYTPSGSLVLIANQQASIYSATGGTITVQNARQGTLAVTMTMSGASPIHISGNWACSA